MTAVKAERVTFASEAVALAGEFRSGVALAGEFRSGVALAGEFRSGAALAGEFRSGAALAGEFRSGAALAGDFSSDTALAGELLPAQPHGQPGLVLTGPFTGVKEQVTGTYASMLAEAGFATLAFDHRGFGESGGRPGHEDSQGKLADLRAAVSFLAARAEVDAARIGIVGVCLGGGYAVRAAAADPRVKAVAGIAGGYNSPSQLVEAMGAGPYRSALAAALERYDEYLPAVAPGGGEAAMGGEEPYAYYGTARSFSPHWRNQVTRGSLHSLMTFDALGAAELLACTPLLIVHGRTDAYCSPELAQALYERTPGDKEIRWIDASQHIDLYDREPYVSQAAGAAAAFLHRKLVPAAP